MSLLNRHHPLSLPLAIAAGALVIALVISSYLDERNALIAERDIKFKACDDAQAMQKKEIELRRFLATAGSSMMFDPSTIEGQIVHLAGDWEDQTSIRNPSFQRTAQAEEHGFTRLSFQISGVGSIAQVAGLLYRAEKSPIPLRIDVAQIRPLNETSADMEIHLTVSALCRSGHERTGVSQIAADGAGNALTGETTTGGPP